MALARLAAPEVFEPLGLVVRRNRFGCVAFLLAYQAICSTAAVAGYLEQITGRHRRWK